MFILSKKCPVEAQLAWELTALETLKPVHR